MAETVLVTALPNSVVKGKDGKPLLRICAMLIPQRGGQTFKSGAFEKWPEALAGGAPAADGFSRRNLTWKINLGGTVRTIAGRVAVQPGLWTRLFAGVAADKPRAGAIEERRPPPTRFIANSVRELRRIQTEMYRDAAASAAE